MELLWQNGQVVVQRTSKRPPLAAAETEIPPEQLTARGIRSGAEELHLFMQEDEMTSFLQYPIDDSSIDRDLYSDLIFSAPTPPPIPTPITAIAPPRAPPPPPPIPPPAQKMENSPRFQNFVHFSMIPSTPRIDQTPRPNSETILARESTVVESNVTPAERESRVSHTAADCRTNSNTAAIIGATSASTRELAGDTCELTVSSSPGGSGSSFCANAGTRRHLRKPSATCDRKRKNVEAVVSEDQSEEAEFKSAETKRLALTKRSRAAEVHNLSERRRRDRINEKMRALQQLIPGCNKTDKASMLDEAIQYLKSLQLQVQMMSMGCGMVPMMCPGMHRYMAPMSMGMGIAMATNRPFLPYTSMLPAGSGMLNHMNTRFQLPAFHLPPVPVPDSSTTLPASQGQADPVVNPIDPSLSQPRMPNYMYPFPQFPGLQQALLPLPQNEAAMQHTGNEPGTSKGIDNPVNQKSAG